MSDELRITGIASRGLEGRMSEQLPEILTTRNLADHLRCSEALVRDLANRGEIPGAFRLGKLWRFHRDAALAVTTPIERQSVQAPPRGGSAFARDFPEFARK